MWYLQRLCVETENRRSAQTEACAAVLYVYVVDWAIHRGHTVRPQGTCALEETIAASKVMATQALGRAELTRPYGLEKLPRWRQ